MMYVPIHSSLDYFLLSPASSFAPVFSSWTSSSMLEYNNQDACSLSAHSANYTAGSYYVTFIMAASSDNSELEFPFNSDHEYELKLGNSFQTKGGKKTAFHTIRCKVQFPLMFSFITDFAKAYELK